MDPRWEGRGRRPDPDRPHRVYPKRGDDLVQLRRADVDRINERLKERQDRIWEQEAQLEEEEGTEAPGLTKTEDESSA